MTKKLKVTLIRSTSGRPRQQRLTAQALGFHRMHQTRIVPDNPAMRGMIDKISHLLKWEAVEVQE
ncbi:50S ribosomal protein L30 [candidate division KSB1 bacterium]|nr:MAG: 50S ribosomal protein L30 [candidate division KSB1 bacterium]